VAHAFLSQEIAHGLDPVKLVATSLATRNVRLDERGICCVELAIDETAEEQFLIKTSRHLLHAP
jgi:hypothetical protein